MRLPKRSMRFSKLCNIGWFRRWIISGYTGSDLQGQSNSATITNFRKVKHLNEGVAGVIVLLCDAASYIPGVNNKIYKNIGVLSMPSFDIVSEIELQEVRHAVENAQRELETRFDFRGVQASFSWADESATLKAEGDFQLQQMLDILRSKLSKRNVDAESLDVGEPDHSGKNFTLKVGIKQGIEQDMAKKIVKLVKDSKVKVQASIQGDQVRVSGKKRDDLQAAIALIKEANLGQPFQFKNFRD